MTIAIGAMCITFLSHVTTDRKLTARSVILSVLLGTEPPRLPTLLLVRTTALFGIAEGTIRTALSRMVAAGELAARRRLVRHRRPPPRVPPGPPVGQPGRHDRARGTAPGSSPSSAPAGARSRAERDEVRASLVAARFAEQREGVWLRPDNLDGLGEVPGVDAVRRHAEPMTPSTLAASLWDLDGWSREAGCAAGEDGRPARPRSRRATPGPWRRASSCPPPSSATSSTTPCCPAALLARGLAGRRPPRGLRPLRRRLQGRAAGAGSAPAGQ